MSYAVKHRSKIRLVTLKRAVPVAASGSRVKATEELLVELPVVRVVDGQPVVELTGRIPMNELIKWAKGRGYLIWSDDPGCGVDVAPDAPKPFKPLPTVAADYVIARQYDPTATPSMF